MFIIPWGLSFNKKIQEGGEQYNIIFHCNYLNYDNLVP